MIAAALLAGLCADLYDDTKASAWVHSWETDNVHIAHAQAEGADILVFRGSVEVQDWIRNANAFPEWHPNLGFVHAGFAAGLDEVMPEVQAAVGDRVVITGHSLGGARARILAALRVIEGWPVEQVTVFGSPRPGFANIARVIQKSGMSHSSYRNRNDPVPLVPGVLPFWEHTEAWTPIDARPADTDFAPLRDHDIGLYVSGLSAPCTQAP